MTYRSGKYYASAVLALTRRQRGHHSPKPRSARNCFGTVSCPSSPILAVVRYSRGCLSSCHVLVAVGISCHDHGDWQDVGDEQFQKLLGDVWVVCKIFSD